MQVIAYNLEYIVYTIVQVKVKDNRNLKVITVERLPRTIYTLILQK